MTLNEESAKAIELQERAELRAMTELEALVAADRLLAMASTATYPPERDRPNGLIERQRILYGIKK